MAEAKRRASRGIQLNFFEIANYTPDVREALRLPAKKPIQDSGERLWEVEKIIGEEFKQDSGSSIYLLQWAPDVNGKHFPPSWHSISEAEISKVNSSNSFLLS